MPSAARPDRGAERALLTREQVACTALEFLDRQGLEALSMRRLAAELGVGAMTLYTYYRSKEELLEAVVDTAVAEAGAPRLDGPWQQQLAELLRHVRRTINRHPALAKLRASRPVLRPEALRFAEVALGILRAAGLDKRDAAMSFRLLFTYVFGYATFSPQTRVARARREAAAAMRALPVESYPQLTAAAEEASEAMGGDEPFEFGLALIIDGIETRVQSRRHRA